MASPAYSEAEPWCYPNTVTRYRLETAGILPGVETEVMRAPYQYPDVACGQDPRFNTVSAFYDLDFNPAAAAGGPFDVYFRLYALRSTSVVLVCEVVHTLDGVDRSRWSRLALNFKGWLYPGFRVTVEHLGLGPLSCSLTLYGGGETGISTTETSAPVDFALITKSPNVTK